MRRYWTVLAGSALSLVGAVDALAGPCCEAFHRNIRWPYPYVCRDRIEVHRPLEIGVEQGWKLQNTLSDYHFDPETGALTDAGKTKIDAILVESPCAFRAVFVLNARDVQRSVARMESVQEYLGNNPFAQDVPIFETCTVPFTFPAQYVDRVARDFIETTPTPRIPVVSGASGGTPAGGQ